MTECGRGEPASTTGTSVSVAHVGVGDCNHDRAHALLGFDTTVRIGGLLHAVDGINDRADLLISDHLLERQQLFCGFTGERDPERLVRESGRPGWSGASASCARS